MKRFRLSLKGFCLLVMFVPLTVCLLAAPAAAEGLLGDVSDLVDQQQYYQLDEVESGGIMPLAISTSTILGVSYSTEGSAGVLTYLNGILLANLTSTDLAKALYRTAYSTQNRLTSLSERIDSLSSSDPYAQLIYNYLEGSHVSGIVGELQNIEHVLGWNGSESTIYELLTGMASVQSDFSKFWGPTGSAFTYFGISGTGTAEIRNVSFIEYLKRFSQEMLYGLHSPRARSYLNSSGGRSAGGFWLSELTADGFLGLSQNLVGLDRNGNFGSIIFGDDGRKIIRVDSVDNLLDGLALLHTSLQAPLAQLQYVLANDDDLAIRQGVKENQESFKDNFTGDGDGAVSGSDVKDVSGLGSSFKDTFSGVGSASDVFSVLGDSENFGFFSQQTANDLNPVSNSAPVAQSLPPLEDDFWVDEDGYYWLRDLSAFDAAAYLEGLS